jgi:hypothetical protein
MIYYSDPCGTSTVTITPTFSSTPTNTPTLGVTNTFTMTPTNTATCTGTNSATQTATNTATNPPLVTSTFTHTPTLTPTSTTTNTVTQTMTNTPTRTVTATMTNSFTNTPTLTLTLTITPTPTITSTLTVTPSPIVGFGDCSGLPIAGYSYPNPATGGNMSVLCNLCETSSVSIAVYNMVAEKIANYDFLGSSGTNIYSLNIGGFAHGIYFLIIQSSGPSGNRKSGIQKFAVVR